MGKSAIFPHYTGKIIYKWGMISKLPCLMKLMASLLVEKNATVLDEFFWHPKLQFVEQGFLDFLNQLS